MEFDTDLLNKLLNMKGDGIRHVEATSFANAVLKAVVEITDIYSGRIGTKLILQFASSTENDTEIGQGVFNVLKALGAVAELNKETGELTVSDFPSLVSYSKQSSTHYGTELFPEFDKDTWEILDDAEFITGIVLEPINKETHEPLIVLRADSNSAQVSCIFSMKKGHHHASSDELRHHYALTNVRMDKAGLMALKAMIKAGLSRFTH